MDESKAKKIIKKLIFPHISLLFLLLPTSIGAMLYTIARFGNDHPITIVSYVIAFYTLVIWSARVPAIVAFFKRIKTESKYIGRWIGDVHLRVKFTLSAAAIWNGGYGILQLMLGIYHRSAWFFSLAAYYLLLALMRSYLMHHTMHHIPESKMRRELSIYRICGCILLVMNLALSAVMLYRIHDGRMSAHHEITTIAMAAYTFTSFTMATVNLIRYRRYNSPVFSASKAISFAAACVSMLSLESTMLATFDKGMSERTIILFLALSGAGVSAIIIAMAIYMILNSTEKIKNIDKGDKLDNNEGKRNI